MSQHGDDSATGTRVWFITGASRGLGRAFAEAALTAGDRVVGIARDVSDLAELVDVHRGRLVVFPLDVADRAEVFAGVDRAVAAFGRLDVVVNNAGQLLFGMVEETTEAQARAQMDTNFFGALWTSQAVVPHLRAQGSGHIIQVTAMGAGGGSVGTGLYGASKAALNAISEALAGEVESFGIAVTILEPGPYDTSLGDLGLTATEERQDYGPVRAELAESWSDATAAPNPAQAASVLLEIVRMPHPPARLILGGAAYDQVRQGARDRADEYSTWEHLSRKADSTTSPHILQPGAPS